MEHDTVTSLSVSSLHPFYTFHSTTAFTVSFFLLLLFPN